MTPETIIDVMRGAIEAGGVIVAPVLIIGLLTGVLVSIFQAATQINDQTLVIVPKILATLLTLMLLGSWMLQVYIDFMRAMLLNLPNLVGQG
ncbi:MAG TPA: flagellar biosynthesis protein FliQ [Methylomirabilota bacterium]|jgi:flagellar biosynthetic protein FliQ|nr:flagellar biosynthesis protein FliQ [Methylomirabilota bacterium]